MATGRKSYPYPVLGNGDDVAGQFNPSMQYSVNQDCVELACSFSLTNKYINQLISDGKACYSIEVECGNTYYRNVFMTTDDMITIKVPDTKLRGEVNIGFYVCSNNNIPNYLPDGTHEDFGDEPVFIEKGDILATGGTTSIVATKSFDPLKAPISSIIKLKSTKLKEININYGGDRIIIELPKREYETYGSVKSASGEIIHSSIVFPVLLDALYEITKGDGIYDGLGWSARLKQICRERSIDPENQFSAAQQLLGSPIERTLSWRKEKLLDEDEEEDDE